MGAKIPRLVGGVPRLVLPQKPTSPISALYVPAVKQEYVPKPVPSWLDRKLVHCSLIAIFFSNKTGCTFDVKFFASLSARGSSPSPPERFISHRSKGTACPPCSHDIERRLLSSCLNTVVERTSALWKGTRTEFRSCLDC